MNNKFNWLKLTSRKFWAGIISFAGALLVAFNVDKITTEQILLILGGIGSLIGYMFAEAYVDGKRAGDVIDGIIIENIVMEEADDHDN
jgi:hypothetical protein